MHTIATALVWAKKTLVDITLFPDAEILLAFLLHVSRSYLLAFPERELTQTEWQNFQKLILQRKEGVPTAYLTGQKEFWSLNLTVTQAVLIPRPETELLVELVLQHVRGEKIIIADLGTGSGAIALALAHEHPDWEIHATDASAAALRVAEKNAERLQIKNIYFHQGSWCAALPELKFSAIVSNPPYIARNDEHVEKNTARFEPEIALFAEENGLADIQQIAATAYPFLISSGCLLLEHGFQQAEAVKTILKNLNYTDINSYKDLAGHERVTLGRTKPTKSQQ